MNRTELANYLKNLPVNTYSNLKFYSLLKSRLLEHAIPLADAVLIAKNVKYDFSNVPEDNDALSEFATILADWCAKSWRQAVKVNRIKDINEVINFLVPNFVLTIDSL